MIIPENGVLSDQFVKLQEYLKPDFSIEIGAHGAEFSLEISKIHEIKAIAFEASPDVFAKYKDENNTDLVSYVNCAISNLDGIASFKVHQDPFAGNNSIKHRVGHSYIREYEVKSSRLDTYLKDYTFKNACLWIDVEGANREVLLGALETLDRCSSIFIETEDYSFWQDQWLTNDVVKFLDLLGFKQHLSENVYTEQKNIIFLRKELFNDISSS